MGLKGLLTTLALGAGAMYLMDPELGDQRRNEMKEQLDRVSSDAESIWRDGVADLQHRAQQLRYRTENAAQESMQQMTGAARQAAGNLQEAAQGVTATGQGMTTRFDGQMAPGPRLLAIAGGGLLTLYGRTRRGLMGGAVTALGLNFLSKGLVNRSLPEVVRQAQRSPMFEGGTFERMGERIRDLTSSVGGSAAQDSSMRDFGRRSMPENPAAAAGPGARPADLSGAGEGLPGEQGAMPSSTKPGSELTGE